MIEACKHLDSQDRGSPLLPLLYTLNRLPASRLLPPRSGLERSDFVHWPIASFRCYATIGRLSGAQRTLTSHQPGAFMGSRPSQVATNSARVESSRGAVMRLTGARPR
jgi:hypothetical protein